MKSSSLSFKGFIKKGALIGSGLALVLGMSGCASNATTPKMTTEWDKVFPKSEKVDHKKVTFKNRFGITLVGDLYIPKNRADKKLPALVLSGPYGAVKEQASGLYAQNLAERGYVTLAFDPSFTGESGGEPRNVSSPDINTEDMSAGVDYIGLLPYVDKERVGIMSVCGFGGIGLNATAVDKRVKAVAVASMYDMSRVMAKGYFDSMPLEGRTQLLNQLSQQRWVDAANGTPAVAPNGLPNELSGKEPEFVQGYFNFYKTKRGFHPRSINSNGGWNITNSISYMNTPLMTYIKEISPRPILFIAGEKAHSLYFTQDAYKAANEPKELMIIPGAVHTDLYDNLNVIPFDKIASFFAQNLK